MIQKSKSARVRLLCGSAAASLMLWTGAANAQDVVQINIPPQPLAKALYTFAAQSGHQVMFAPELASAKTTRGVTGVADQQEALRQLLLGTGLTFQQQDDTFLIKEGPANPQGGSADGGADTNVVQELVVTAQKKSESIQVVPIAISAFSQQDLTTRQIAGGPDLMTQVPNMTFTKTNFTGYSIQIRGIGTQAISATTDAAVAVAFNNTPFIRNRFFEQEFYDLERIEVLRGPQGTLYGRNATAGVVNILSAKPKFDYEARLSGDIANYGSHRLEGMLNIPLVEDKVALRIAGAWTKRDGFVENQITGNPIDGRDLWSTRVSLRFAPTDKLDVNLIWEHFQEKDDRLRSGKQLCHQDDRDVVAGLGVHWVPSDGYNNNMNQGCLPASLYSPDSYEAPNGYSLPYYMPTYNLGVPTVPGFNPYSSLVQSPDLRVIESTVDPKYWAKSDLVELQWTYDIGDNLTLSSETSYNYDTIYSLQDFNRFNTAAGAFQADGVFSARGRFMHLNAAGNWEFCDPQIGCADRLVAIDVSRALSSQFSQEFRLASDFDGIFNFSLGANYLRYDTEDKYYVFINTLTMVAAAGTQGVNPLPAWIPNVSDNRECLPEGDAPPDTSLPNGTIRTCMYIDPNPIESVNDRGHNYFLSRNPYKLISYAVFGETYWQLSDNLKLTAGLRITRDEKEAPRIPSWLIGARTVGLSVAEVVEQKWTEPTGRLALDWKPDLGFTDQTLLYASYSHGYKAGGANPPPAGVTVWPSQIGEIVAKFEESATKPKTFDPEFVNAFEVGAKNTFADGKATLNLSAFYYDYKGYQVSQIIDRSAVNYNFDSTVWGLEIEADWRPLQNLRLGFKGGYERTRIADGEQAIDIMDRTAGKEGWVVYRPFPSFPSNCVLPTRVVDPDGDGQATVFPSGGNMGPCEFAYAFLVDPVTHVNYGNNLPPPPIPDSVYQGYNPRYDVGQHRGEGFLKELGGNELPNAPHFTATITADYTIPLPHDWLATLHTDLYYQSEAWTRVFNTPGFDRLKAYNNINVAAIFTNEAAGWKVMFYVKNVLDRDSITGAFLNSDDTGLTTNVFLTEPRLYGLRVTKEFSGGPWWTGATGKGPFPLWVELGGTVARQDAPYETLEPDVFKTFPTPLAPSISQHRDLDWGDQREVALTWQPAGQPWRVRAAYRFGDANSDTTYAHRAAPAGPSMCSIPVAFLEDGVCKYYLAQTTGTIWSDSEAREQTEHALADFSVGRDFGLGAGLGIRSTLSGGLRYGSFTSRTHAILDGVPYVNVPDGWSGKYTQYAQYRATVDAKREFSGAGPSLSWDAAKHLLGSDATGFLDADWSVAAGVLFGKQKTTVAETFGQTHFDNRMDFYHSPGVPLIYEDPTSVTRKRSKNVPFVDLKLGLTYEIQRLKIGAGYRWERYFNVLDAGYTERKDYDRTIDGPYFKLSVGFGG